MAAPSVRAFCTPLVPSSVRARARACRTRGSVNTGAAAAARIRSERESERGPAQALRYLALGRQSGQTKLSSSAGTMCGGRHGGWYQLSHTSHPIIIEPSSIL